MDESGVVFYCDFHAHSRKFNVFIYGCENRRHSEKYLREQIYPLMLHKNTAEKFSFEDCRFKIQRQKETTGRVVFWNMGITCSYTLEASYGGKNLNMVELNNYYSSTILRHKYGFKSIYSLQYRRL